jgi:hypothetical protein
MMMKVSALLALVAVGMAPALAVAATYTFQPTPHDLYDLDHTKAYSWGMDLVLAPGEAAVAATLTFDNIRNWDDNPNVLYVHLLDTCPLGVQHYTDNEGGGDYFASFPGGQTHLVTYTNLPSTPQDLVYTFTPGDLAALNTYLADHRFGIGIDPDCHFYNDGITLGIVTPEPATIMLLAIGVVTLLRRLRSA